MRRQLELFFTALGFFTRVPVPASVPWSADRLNHAARYFPLVGWVVAASAAAAFWLAAHLLPASVAVLVSMAVTIRLTGAFHEDGLADSCDGLGGGWDRPQILAIMKDSRLGAYGAVGLTLMLLAKALALIELAGLGTKVAIVALLIAHPLSRLASTSLIHFLDYVREDEQSKARPLARRMQRHELLIAAAPGTLPLLLAAPQVALATLAAVAATTWWLARMLQRRLGGYTGDCLGAAQQLTELACYLTLLGAWTSS